MKEYEVHNIAEGQDDREFRAKNDDAARQQLTDAERQAINDGLARLVEVREVQI